MVSAILWRLFCSLVVTCSLAPGQEPAGSVTGSVIDPSGATVPQAAVIVKNQRTGRAVSVRTATMANSYSLRLPRLFRLISNSFFEVGNV